MKFRQQYADPDEDQYLADVCAIACSPDEDVTEQHHKDECDITLMLARFGYTPERGLPVVTISDVIRDVTLLPDTLQEAFDAIEAGKEAFASLPASVRAYFDNDPRRFIAASEEQLIASGIPAAEKAAPSVSGQETVLEHPAT